MHLNPSHSFLKYSSLHYKPSHLVFEYIPLPFLSNPSHSVFNLFPTNLTQSLIIYCIPSYSFFPIIFIFKLISTHHTQIKGTFLVSPKIRISSPCPFNIFSSARTFHFSQLLPRDFITWLGEICTGDCHLMDSWNEGKLSANISRQVVTSKNNHAHGCFFWLKSLNLKNGFFYNSETKLEIRRDVFKIMYFCPLQKKHYW